jgi:hypothetical protein
MAVRKSELSNLKLQAATAFGFLFKIGNGEGASAEYEKKQGCHQEQRSEPTSLLGIPFQLRRALDASQLNRPNAEPTLPRASFRYGGFFRPPQRTPNFTASENKPAAAHNWKANGSQFS